AGQVVKDLSAGTRYPIRDLSDLYVTVLACGGMEGYIRALRARDDTPMRGECPQSVACAVRAQRDGGGRGHIAPESYEPLLSSTTTCPMGTKLSSLSGVWVASVATQSVVSSGSKFFCGASSREKTMGWSRSAGRVPLVSWTSSFLTICTVMRYRSLPVNTST